VGPWMRDPEYLLSCEFILLQNDAEENLNLNFTLS